MHQSRMVAPLGDDLPDAVFLAKTLRLLDVLDFHTFLRSDPFGVGTNRLTERLREPRKVVEHLDVATIEHRRHRACVTNAGQRSLNQDAVEAGENSSDAVTMTLDQIRHHRTISPTASPRFFLGSGYAGVGKACPVDPPMNGGFR